MGGAGGVVTCCENDKTDTVHDLTMFLNQRIETGGENAHLSSDENLLKQNLGEGLLYTAAEAGNWSDGIIEWQGRNRKIGRRITK